MTATIEAIVAWDPADAPFPEQRAVDVLASFGERVVDPLTELLAAKGTPHRKLFERALVASTHGR